MFKINNESRERWRTAAAAIAHRLSDPRVTLATLAIVIIATLPARCGSSRDATRVELGDVHLVCHEEPTGGAR